MLYTIFQAVIILAIICVIALVINKVEDRRRSYMSFRESLDLTGLPIITFKWRDKRLHFLLDTGANFSVINEKVAAKIAENTQINMRGSSKLVGLGGEVKECPHLPIELSYKDKLYQEKFQVTDMSKPFKEIKNMHGVTLHGILGNSFLERYKYVLDFKEMIAYSKK